MKSSLGSMSAMGPSGVMSDELEKPVHDSDATSPPKTSSSSIAAVEPLTTEQCRLSIYDWVPALTGRARPWARRRLRWRLGPAYRHRHRLPRRGPLADRGDDTDRDAEAGSTVRQRHRGALPDGRFAREPAQPFLVEGVELGGFAKRPVGPNDLAPASFRPQSAGPEVQQAVAGLGLEVTPRHRTRIGVDGPIRGDVDHAASDDSAASPDVGIDRARSSAFAETQPGLAVQRRLRWGRPPGCRSRPEAARRRASGRHP